MPSVQQACFSYFSVSLHLPLALSLFLFPERLWSVCPCFLYKTYMLCIMYIHINIYCWRLKVCKSATRQDYFSLLWRKSFWSPKCFKCIFRIFIQFSGLFMVLILDGISEHVAHAWRKIGLLSKNTRFVTAIGLIKCLEQVE